MTPAADQEPPKEPKYSLPEIERRWLVHEDAVAELLASHVEGAPDVIEDRYVTGTRLRLRRVRHVDGGETLKLCLKYGQASPLREPITNLYLTAHEYAVLAVIDGAPVVKRRFRVAGGSLDVFDEPAGTPTYFEREFATVEAAMAYEPPAFVAEEVTGEPEHTGANIARTRRPCPTVCE